MKRATNSNPAAQQAAPPTWVAYVLLPIAPLCWGGNIVVARGVIDILPPVGFAFWRWTLAFFMLLPFAWGRARRDWPQAKAGWKNLLVLGITGIAGFNTLLYTAVHTTTAINGSLIQTTMPGFIILMSVTFLGDKVSLRQLIGAAACVLGAALVVLHGNPAALYKLDFALGDLLMIVAVVLYAVYSLALSRRPPVHPLSLMLYIFAIGVLGLLPLYLWELAESGGFAVTGRVLLSIGYVALFPSIVAYFCWNRGIDIIGPNRGGLFICLIPVFASMLAIVFLGEILRAYHITGMLLIIAGMFIFSLR
ncbi:MAG: DMT family transporter [Desulfobacterales bacterium]|nr:DMT family transporter [Desulfobacterales bacterium]